MRSTFYRRPLPKHLVAFDSTEGKQFFRRCLDKGHAEGYFHLADNFSSQSEPAYCGPSSLAMVLNALQIDPRRRWKGAWRWYTDELLESCLPMSVVKRKGITFSQFACNGHCEVVAKRPTEFTFDNFVADLRRVTSRMDNGEHMVVSYARATLGQTGDGHFSPIGAFYPGRPHYALVLDVARFKYPSYFCQTRLLYEAMKPIDRTTGKCRGWFLLRPQQHSPVYGCASVCKDWA
ncbi:phytochelatin synthase [Syncephalis fuscata]|nr:phytochelatin synthase [Syncephalis fuscata]